MCSSATDLVEQKGMAGALDWSGGQKLKKISADYLDGFCQWACPPCRALDEGGEARAVRTMASDLNCDT